MAMNELILFLMNIIENIVIIQIIKNFFKVKYRFLEYIFILLFSILAYSVNTMEKPLFLIFALFVLVAYSLFNYYGSYKKIILISSSVFVINIYLSFIIVTALNSLDTTISQLLEEKLSFYVCIVIITKFILIAIFSLIQSFLFKQNYTIKWSIIFLELCLFFIAILTSFYIYIHSYISAEAAFMSLFIIAFTLFIIIFFFSRYQKYLEFKKNIKKWEEEKTNYINQANQLHCLYDKVFLETQQLNEEFSKLEKYIGNKDKENSIRLIHQIKKSIFKVTEFNNDTLNFLLNGKLQIMNEYDIKFQAAISVSLNRIKKDDLTYILGNLLDSAIEQVKFLSDAYINLNISQISAGSKILIEFGPTNEEFDIKSLFSKIEPLVKQYSGLLYYQTKSFKCYYKIIFMQEVND